MPARTTLYDESLFKVCLPIQGRVPVRAILDDPTRLGDILVGSSHGVTGAQEQYGAREHEQDKSQHRYSLAHSHYPWLSGFAFGLRHRCGPGGVPLSDFMPAGGAGLNPSHEYQDEDDDEDDA